ncbi:ImmA/IrrE family metallo-endopeptidase [Alicyclobacillus macrosporangiidus]|uniref:IrrE N-terminal-like domain-containing protein n=1 Tax=Alicyclobacillus macrosporangiidus TaxID=392015 RepID=A0A1I7JAD7_9BACL|nr:ImmA/IrrE family metallo-endopeptidase [Alicyclobacillus macrosporangiidus]SFU82125.1 protein of unknown function [Alicyclobacillus macrosporangiidus]
MDIKTCVKRLVSRYRTNDPFLIADKRGIVIITERLGNILGYHISSRRIHIIHLNWSLDGPLRRFVCAHELGHAILHPKVNTPFLRRSTLFSIDRIEREANEFAVELLLPDEELELVRFCDPVTAREIAAQYGIPNELMRLKRLDRSRKAVVHM